jgi:hypothetical protein
MMPLTAAMVAMSSAPAVTVTAGTVSVTVTEAGIASIVDSRGVHYALLPGSGTVLAGCTVGSAAIAQTPGGSAALTRTMACEPNDYHNLTGAKVTVVDTFSPTAADSVRWTVNISSASKQAWGTAVTASLGFAAWNNSTRVWLGGPRSGDAPSLTYDAFAPWSLQEQEQQQQWRQHAAAAVPARGGSGGESANASWYIAKGYDATYDCRSGPCVQSGTTASSDACRAACDKAKCNVFAWSDRSRHCWFRTDNVWGEKSTRHPYAAVSGCRQGSDPVTGNPWVKGCGTTPPLGPSPAPQPGSGAAR